MTIYDMVEVIDAVIDLHRSNGADGDHEVFNFDIMGVPFGLAFIASGLYHDDPLAKKSRYGDTSVKYVACVGGFDPDLPDGWREQYGDEALSESSYVPSDEVADLINRSPSTLIQRGFADVIRRRYDPFTPHLDEMPLDEYLEDFWDLPSDVYTFDFMGTRGEFDLHGTELHITLPDLYLREKFYAEDFDDTTEGRRSMLTEAFYNLVGSTFKVVERDPLRMRPLTFYR